MYYFSLFKAPSGILKELEGIRRKFFWGANNDNRKSASIAWDKVLNSKEKGGLGIGSLQAQNYSLLVKWWWRFKTEEYTLWRKAIVALHGPIGRLGEEIRGARKNGI